jgi:hypothetical protein
MRNLLIGLLGAAVIGTGGYAAASGLDDSVPARTISLPGATTGDPTTSGTTTTGTTTARTTTTDEREDISGPCDEAEHANDPRCTGVTTGDDRDDDHSGPGRGGDDDRDDDHDEDRSGSNRGRG